MRVLVPDDYQDVVRTLDVFALLDGHDVTVLTGPPTPDDLAETEALVLIRERTPVDSALLERAPRLRVLSQTGRGTPHVDLDACAARGIELLLGGGAPVGPAELTWALVLAAARRLPQYAERLRAGEWQRNGLEGTDGALGHVVRGRTLGVLGLGRIGGLVAGYGAAFGMDVLAWGREASHTAAVEAGHTFASSQRDLFERADVVSLHVPLTAETRGLVTADDLAAMRRGSILVNTARAGLVAEGALAAALAAGRPAFAAVDVFDEEPAVGDELLRLPNVIATPHLGYVERDTYERYFGEAFRNLVDFAAG
jgi:D-3-phosphoglycerate dehydrogenase / 2-oxoglutarate reductase